MPNTTFGLLLILALFYAAVLTVNFKRAKRLLMRLPLFPGEAIENEVTIPAVVSQKQMLLSNFRLAELGVRWLFSFKTLRVSDLDTCDAYTTRHLLNPVILLVGYFLYGISPLVGYLVILYSAVSFLIHVTYSLKHGGSGHRVQASTSLPSVVDRLWKFSLDTERVRRAIKIGGGHLLAPGARPSYEVSADFRYDPGFRYLLAWLLLVAVAQRIEGKYISLDDGVFGPLYLAAPLVAGAVMGPAQAFIMGFFGFWSIFTAAKPLMSMGLGTYSGAVDAQFSHLLILSLGFGAIALLASLISRGKHPELAMLAVLVWPLAVACTAPKSVADFALYGQTFLAAGYGTVGALLAEGMRESGIKQPPSAEDAREGGS